MNSIQFKLPRIFKEQLLTLLKSRLSKMIFRLTKYVTVVSLSAISSLALFQSKALHRVNYVNHQAIA